MATPQSAKAKPQDKESATAFTADQLIEGLLDSYARFHEIPGLVVDYRIDHQVLEKNTAHWAWPWAEFTNKIRPGQPGMLHLRFRRPEKLSDGIVIFESIETSDKEFRADLRSRVSAPPPKGNYVKAKAALMRAERHNTIPGFCYYFNFLSYPVSADPEVGTPKRELYPTKDYWLPQALATNRRAYQVRPKLEKVEGVDCYVVERPGLDAIWVQTEPAFIIRRRQFHWSDGGGLRQDASFADLKEVAPKVWLPRFIKFEYYTAPWDDPKVHSRVGGRQLLKVSKIEITELPDSEFRAQIPEGAYVTELISSEKGTFFVNQPGMDPFEQAVSRVTPVRKNYWTLVLAILILASVSAGLIVWQRRRLRAKG